MHTKRATNIDRSEPRKTFVQIIWKTNSIAVGSAPCSNPERIVAMKSLISGESSSALSMTFNMASICSGIKSGSIYWQYTYSPNPLISAAKKNTHIPKSHRMTKRQGQPCRRTKWLIIRYTAAGVAMSKRAPNVLNIEAYRLHTEKRKS